VCLSVLLIYITTANFNCFEQINDDDDDEQLDTITSLILLMLTMLSSLCLSDQLQHQKIIAYARVLQSMPLLLYCAKVVVAQNKTPKLVKNSKAT